MNIQDYDDVTAYSLDADEQEALLAAQNECSFIWDPKDHWPVGVMMSYVWRDGRFWLTCTSQRKRVTALRRNNHVSVVVSNAGTSLGLTTSVTAKGICHLRDDDETKAWFYPALAKAVIGEQPELCEMFVAMLDSERRLIFEVVPEKWITFDAAKMMTASLAAWTAGTSSDAG